MSFLKKATTSIKDIQTLKGQMDKMGITKKVETFMGKDKTNQQTSVTVTDMGQHPTGQQQYPPPPAPGQYQQYSAPGHQYPATPAQAQQYAPPPVQDHHQYTPSLAHDQQYVPPAAAPAPVPVHQSQPAAAVAAPHAIPAGVELAVPVNTAEGAPQKLPLVARKSVRDHFESRKASIESQLTSILGTLWSIHVDVVGVYSYSVHDSQTAKDPGAAFASYFDALVYYVDSFVKTYGDHGRQQVNQLAHAHVATLEPTFDPAVTISSCDFAEGKLRLLFNPSQLGNESARASESLDQIIQAREGNAQASSGASGSNNFSLAARQSIRDDYEKNIPEQLSLMRRYLDAPAIELEPNFESNYEKLLAYENQQPEPAQQVEHQLSSKIGASTLSYFLGVNNQLYNKAFYNDDMMRDAFKEAVHKNKVELRATDAPQQTASTSAIKDGVLVILVPVTQWLNNPDAACSNLEDLL